MATAWTYHDWRSESGTTAQRARLVLHIEEVTQVLAGYQRQSAAGQNADRFQQLDAYLKRLEAKLDEYDAALGLGLQADRGTHLVQGVPRYDYNGS